MKRIWKYMAFVVALPVALMVVLVMVLQGCKREQVVCDPVPPPARGTTGPGPGGAGGGAGTTGVTTATVPTMTTAPATTRRVPATRPDTPPICDPVHNPPPPPEETGSE